MKTPEIVRLVLVVLFLSTGVSAGVAQGQSAEYLDGLEAFELGDYPEALFVLEPLARGGDGQAQTLLAQMYDEGLGVDQSPAKAAYWYGLAAVQGNRDAQHVLANMFLHGRGVVQNTQTAALWMRSAAEQGCIKSQKALGSLYREGVGVERDSAEAAYWLEKAAWQGDSEAQRYVALAYSQGDGVPRDLVRAFMWLSVLELHGQENVSPLKEWVADQLSPGQLEEAVQQAKAWRRRGPEHFQ